MMDALCALFAPFLSCGGRSNLKPFNPARVGDGEIVADIHLPSRLGPVAGVHPGNVVDMATFPVICESTGDFYRGFWIVRWTCQCLGL